MSFTKQTQCHLHGGKEGLNHGQALPETDQAEREERIAVHHEPVRPSPVRVQGEDADKSKRGIRPRYAEECRKEITMADCARRHLPHCFQEREMLYFVRGLLGTLLSVFESYAAAEGCETQAADDTKKGVSKLPRLV